MMNTIMNGGIGLMVVGMFLGILLLAVLIWALLTWLNRQRGRPQPRQEFLSPREPTAWEVLQRFARGETDQATFQQMREQLGATSPSSLDEGTERSV